MKKKLVLVDRNLALYFDQLKFYKYVFVRTGNEWIEIKQSLTGYMSNMPI